MLETRPAGRMQLRFSVVGLGCSSFWARKAFSERAAVRIVHAALDEGITFFDTGGHYGWGTAEERLGKALASRSSEDVVVSTKAGTELTSSGSARKDFSPEGVRRSVERSLSRLGIERISILHLHDPRGNQVSDELCAELEKLREEGLVRYFGLNGADEEPLRRVLGLDLFDSVMGDYNVLRRGTARVITRVAESGKCFIAATPLAQSLYSNKLFWIKRPADVWYLARALGKHRGDVVRGFSYRFMNHYEGWTGAEIALAYVLRNPHVACAVFGTTSAERLRQNVQAAGRVLPEAIAQRIDALPI